MSPSSSKPPSSTPATLRSAKESWKLKKPGTSPDRRLPLIVHMEPARIIHAKPQEFMGLVQRLTGKPSPAAASSPATCSVSVRSIPDINVAYEAEDEDSSFCL